MGDGVSGVTIGRRFVSAICVGAWCELCGGRAVGVRSL